MAFPVFPHMIRHGYGYALANAGHDTRAREGAGVHRFVWRKSPSIITDAAALRTLHRAEDIGSALKGSVNVCQRQLVNEVLRPLVSEFVRNFGRENATPSHRGSNVSLLGRVQAVELIRHNALQHLRAAPTPLGGELPPLCPHDVRWLQNTSSDIGCAIN